MSKDHWHYSRTEFLNTVFLMLVNGPVQALSLFGPRRIGKTHFLKFDLAPHAAMYKHRVAYASFWQMRTSPLAVLLYELDQALWSGSPVARIARRATGLAPKLRLRSPDGSGEIEIDLANLRDAAPADHLLLLDQYCEKLSSKKKPALLLFDEFQEITRSDGAADIMAALRTSLDKRRDGLSVVFTGSSQSGLKRVFSQRDAPFYRFATAIDLPALDEDFVKHQVGAFHKTFRSKVGLDVALNYFERFGRNPLFLQRWLNALPLSPDPESARSRVEEELADEFDFERVWLGLTATQRLALRMVADDVDKPYGAAGRALTQNLAGKDPDQFGPAEGIAKACVRKPCRSVGGDLAGK